MQKNRVISIAVSVFLVFLAVIFTSSCGEEEQNNTLKQIKITSELNSTFYVGESVDFSASEFEVTFLNGEVKTVTMQDENMYSNYDKIDNTTAGDRTVIFVYRLSASDAVYVNFVVHFVLDNVASFSVDESSYPSVVKQNDTLDLTGIKAVATLDSGEVINLTYADVTITDFSTKNVGTLDIEVWYKAKCEHIYVQVIAHSVVMCEAQGMQSEYALNSNVNFGEIRLMLQLDDGEVVYVWGEDNVSFQTNANFSVAGEYYVQFYYIGSTYLVENQDNAKTLPIPFSVK